MNTSNLFSTHTEGVYIGEIMIEYVGGQGTSGDLGGFSDGNDPKNHSHSMDDFHNNEEHMEYDT